jgi:hypothetical protein
LFNSEQGFDHRYNFLTPIPLRSGKVDQLPDPGNDSASLRCPGDGHTSAALEVEDALVSKCPERPEDGIRVNAEHGGDVSGGRKALAGSQLTLGDVPPDLRRHLLMQRDGLVSGDLDIHDGDMQSITIVKIEAELRTELPSSDPELVIREARRRQRRRRLVIFGVVVVLAASGVIAVVATGADRSVPPARTPIAKTPVHPTNVPAPPVVAILSAGQFAGTWHVHTTSITIGADGIGTANWPGPISPGESEATAVPNRADLHLTAVNGTQATAAITGSTDPTELPDGPVRLQITNQDLLQIVPSQTITVTPLRWTGLCGASASALTLAQQTAAGINCGA